MKKVLIVGANFDNKGALSMLFVTIDEIKRRNPNTQVYFGGIEKWKAGVYSFDQLYYRDYNKAIAMGSVNGVYGLYRCMQSFAKDVIKTIMGKGEGLSHIFDLRKVIKDIDLIIDVSGFNIGSQWSVFTHEDYFDNIRLAMKYNIPIILMPQSFGPFEYEKKYRFLLDRINTYFKYPKIIFAREKDSYNKLKNKFHLSNIRLSTDLVLQNKQIDLSNLYLKNPIIQVPKVLQNSVGIVPNSQCLAHSHQDMIIELYSDIIDELVSKNKNVYIFRHSSGDAKICSIIYNCTNKKDVHYINREFTCVEYNEFIKQFDFIICSRYHGIVNAYRNNIPAIILGWALKYYELAELMNQKQYHFDVTKELNIKNVLNAINLMLNQHLNEKKVIEERLQVIQQDNCFECLTQFL